MWPKITAYQYKWNPINCNDPNDTGSYPTHHSRTSPCEVPLDAPGGFFPVHRNECPLAWHCCCFATPLGSCHHLLCPSAMCLSAESWYCPWCLRCFTEALVWHLWGREECPRPWSLVLLSASGLVKHSLPKHTTWNFPFLCHLYSTELRSGSIGDGSGEYPFFFQN